MRIPLSVDDYLEKCYRIQEYLLNIYKLDLHCVYSIKNLEMQLITQHNEVICTITHREFRNKSCDEIIDFCLMNYQIKNPNWVNYKHKFKNGFFDEY